MRLFNGSYSFVRPSLALKFGLEHMKGGLGNFGRPLSALILPLVRDAKDFYLISLFLLSWYLELASAFA